MLRLRRSLRQEHAREAEDHVGKAVDGPPDTEEARRKKEGTIYRAPTEETSKAKADPSRSFGMTKKERGENSISLTVFGMTEKGKDEEGQLIFDLMCHDLKKSN